jgi:hypothetical protein
MDDFEIVELTIRRRERVSAVIDRVNGGCCCSVVLLLYSAPEKPFAIKGLYDVRNS